MLATWRRDVKTIKTHEENADQARECTLGRRYRLHPKCQKTRGQASGRLGSPLCHKEYHNIHTIQFSAW